MTFTVKDLIEILQQLNPDDLVVVPGYEDGMDPVNYVGEVHVSWRDNNRYWYLGEFYAADSWSKEPRTRVVSIGGDRERHFAQKGTSFD